MHLKGPEYMLSKTLEVSFATSEKLETYREDLVNMRKLLQKKCLSLSSYILESKIKQCGGFLNKEQLICMEEFKAGS